MIASVGRRLLFTDEMQQCIPERSGDQYGLEALEFIHDRLMSESDLSKSDDMATSKGPGMHALYWLTIHNAKEEETQALGTLRKRGE